MYRNTNDGQTSIYDFILPFGGHLKEDNRWVQLKKHINWDIVDEEYQRNFKNKVTGQEAYPSSVAFGSLYIQRRLNLPISFIVCKKARQSIISVELSFDILSEYMIIVS